MPTDKDRPETWVKYKESMCRTCTAVCCTMPAEIDVEDLLRMEQITADDMHISRKKLAARLKKAGIIQSYREGTKKFMLAQRPSGDCVFLDAQSRLCRVYAKRPEMCRKFPHIGLRPGFCPSQDKSLDSR